MPCSPAIALLLRTVRRGDGNDSAGAGEGGTRLARLGPYPAMDAFDELAHALRGRLIEDARNGSSTGVALETEVRALVDREAPALDDSERAALAERVVRIATGLGPLDPLLADPEVDEVMVNGPGEVWAERAGRLERTGARFGSEAELMHAIERVLAPLG